MRAKINKGGELGNSELRWVENVAKECHRYLHMYIYTCLGYFFYFFVYTDVHIYMFRFHMYVFRYMNVWVTYLRMYVHTYMFVMTTYQGENSR